MATFKNQKVVNYPVEEVFAVFVKLAKRDFENFNLKNPTQANAIRNVGAYSVKEGKLLVKISDFKLNEVYEITSSTPTHTYVTRYELVPVNKDATNIVLVEKDISVGPLNLINTFVAMIFFKGRVKKRFKFVIEGFIKEIENTKSV